MNESRPPSVSAFTRFLLHWRFTTRSFAIDKSDLPKEVRATISKEYKAYKIIETQKVERAADKPILFEVHLENTVEILKVQLEASGVIASQSSKPKKDP